MRLAGPALALLLAAVSAGAEEANQVSVRHEAARLSVTARAPVAQILAEISRVSGIPIHLDPALKASLSRGAIAVAFEALPLEEGLRRLLRDGNFVFVYAPTGLSEVRAYLKGTGTPSGRQVDAGRPVGTSRTARKAARQPSGREDGPALLARLRSDALSHPDPGERVTALDTLSASRDRKLALETALLVLERERDEAVIESALDLLARQESVPLEPVLKLAAGDLSSALRIRALEIASRHGPRDPRVQALLRGLAGSDRRDEIRAAAQSLLNELESARGGGGAEPGRKKGRRPPDRQDERGPR